MDDNQINKLNSFMKSADVLDDYAAIIDPLLPTLAPIKTAFLTTIENIGIEGGLGEEDLTGVAQAKEAKRLEVEKSILTVSRGAEAYYLTQNLRAEMKKVHFNPSQLTNMRGLQLFAAAKRLYNKVNPIAANLINVTQQEFDDLKSNYETFFDLEIEPKRQLEERKVHNDAIDPLLAKGDEQRADITVLMATLATSQANIYNAWLLSLGIDDTGSATVASLTDTGTVAANSVVNINLGVVPIVGSTEIKLSNQGANDLRIGFSDTATALSNQSLVVIAGDDERLTAASLNYNANTGFTFLNLKNESANAVGYTVQVFEV